MEPLETSTGDEAVKGSTTVWRPWQSKQLELFQKVAISALEHQRFTQEYQLVCVQSGVIDFQHRNTRVNGQLVDGMFVVLEPGATWTCQTEDVTSYHLSMNPVWLQETATEMLHWEKSLPHFPSHLLFDPSLSRALRDLIAKSQAPASHLQQEEQLLHLLVPLLHVHAEETEALPRVGWEHPTIKRTKEYLQAHYAQEVALQELAGVVNMSPFHLARVFRQTVGLPPHAYQTQLRLAQARTLLAKGYDVGTVAQETGFFDQTHFTKQFKRHFFMTPGSYRKTARFY